MTVRDLIPVTEDTFRIIMTERNTNKIMLKCLTILFLYYIMLTKQNDYDEDIV